MSSFDIRLIDRGDYARFADLLRHQLGVPLSAEIFDGPFGEPICAVVEHAGKFVAYYSVFPYRCRVAGQFLLAYRGGPFTLPEFRSRGLYAGLAREVFAAIESRGAIHIGFPNSVDTFLGRLGVVKVCEVASFARTTDLSGVSGDMQVTDAAPGELGEWFDSWALAVVPSTHNFLVRTAEYYRWMVSIWFGRNPETDYRIVTLEDDQGVVAVALCGVQPPGGLFAIIDLLIRSPEHTAAGVIRSLRAFAAERGAANITFGTHDSLLAAALKVDGWSEQRSYNFHLYQGEKIRAATGGALLDRPWLLTPFDQAMS